MHLIKSFDRFPTRYINQQNYIQKFRLGKDKIIDKKFTRKI